MERAVREMGLSQPATRYWEGVAPPQPPATLPGCQPPQHSEGSRSTLVPDCASPSGWESPEGGVKQRGRALKGSAVYQLLSRLAPSLSPAGLIFCGPLGLPP